MRMFLKANEHDAEVVVQMLHLRHGSIDQRRAGGYAQPMPAIGKAIRTDKIVGTRRLGRRILRNELLAQQAPCRQHESDSAGQHRKTERRPTEEMEWREAVLAQRAFDDHVGRRCDQGHHPADQCGDGQWHEHAFAVQARLPGDGQDHRDEHGNNRRGAHKRTDATGEHHDEHDQAGLIATAQLHHRLHPDGARSRYSPVPRRR